MDRYQAVMPRRHRYLSIATAALLCLTASALATATAAEPDELRIYAAASLKDVVHELSRRYKADHEVSITGIHAASGTLARQIANGAPADIFIPAHPKWLDWLSNQGTRLGPRPTIAANRLALITASATSKPSPSAQQRLASVASGNERLAIGHPAYVPAGMYARQTLRSLGHWQALDGRLVRAASARATVALVARGGLTVGIAYRTDARVSERVRALGLLPAAAHDPIHYPAAILERASESGQAFHAWLTSPAAQAILAKHGFEKAP